MGCRITSKPIAKTLRCFAEGSSLWPCSTSFLAASSSLKPEILAMSIESITGGVRQPQAEDSVLGLCRFIHDCIEPVRALLQHLRYSPIGRDHTAVGVIAWRVFPDFKVTAGDHLASF